MKTSFIFFRLAAVAGILLGLHMALPEAAKETAPDPGVWWIVQATGAFSAAVARVPEIGANLVANPGLEGGDREPRRWPGGTGRSRPRISGRPKFGPGGRRR